tara:strand:+ start:41 stop:292 length:252 start_codon:yes stop_codon:yes gene_type:complete
MHNIKSTEFKNVNRLYPNSKILGISEYLKAGEWKKSNPLINNENNPFLMVLNSLEAESVQLIIVDQYGIEKRPDYKVKELIND